MTDREALARDRKKHAIGLLFGLGDPCNHVQEGATEPCDDCRVKRVLDFAARVERETWERAIKTATNSMLDWKGVSQRRAIEEAKDTIVKDLRRAAQEGGDG